MRRTAAVLMLSVTVPALIVVPTVGQAAARPHPVAPRLDTLALGGVDATAWAAERTRPAPAEATVERVAGDRPEVFTQQLRTADYSLVGVTWDAEQSAPVDPADLRVTVRTRSGGSWQPWTVLETDSGDGPAEGEGVVPVEGAAAGVGRPARTGTSPYFAGPSDGVQVRVDTLAGTLPTGLRVDLVDPGSSAADDALVATPPSSAQAATGMPAVITRAQWGADESLRNSGPTYEPSVRVVFVHHTATSNSYTKDQAAAAVRSIYAYDTNSLGWSDIAYNVLVDKFGQVFEGRHGGLDRAVRSGATGGFNAQTWAVSALGNYSTSAPSTALVNSLTNVVAWKAGISHLDPAGRATLTAANGAGTTAKYRDGTKVTFNVISGHRDAGSTACPGELLYAKLPAIRSSVEARMGAQLYRTTAAPRVVDKGTTTPVRVQARPMTAQSWRLEITKQGTSTVVRTASGSAAKDELIQVGWNLEGSDGKVVPAGVYTLTLQSWNATSAAVPYAVNVSLFADPNVLPRPADGIFHLEGRGYGHGHGMSQFGAEGAARKGLSYAQILAFYYPGTALATAPAAQTMRVALSQGVRTSTSVPDLRLRPQAGLQVSEGGTDLVLPRLIAGKSVTMWRTTLSGGKLSLFGWVGGAYTPIPGWAARPGPFRFTTAPGASTTSRVTLVRPNGQEVVYRGVVEARANASGDRLSAVSEVLVDDYVKSVVSAEMPGGWSPAAYQAQAVAARSYALFKRAAAVAAGSASHICDTTSCQVYNGYSGETPAEAKAATATARRYLTSAGAPIFAEFGSANGGWSASGGKPYLVAKADPYDGVVTGSANWGHAWTTSVSAASVQAAYRSLGTVQRLVVLGRDGRGEWGGRVTRIRLEGSAADVTVTGTAFRSALGLRSEWFRGQQVAPAPPPVVVPTAPPVVEPTPVRSLKVVAGDRVATLSWTAPRSAGSRPVTGYRVTLSPGPRVIDLPATARSATLDRLVNGRSYAIAVLARSSVGSSSPVRSSVLPTSVYGYQVSVPAARLWSAALPASTDQVVRVLGTAGVPSTGVSAVMLRVTSTGTGERGVLMVAPTGRPAQVAPVAVRSTGRTTNLVTVAPGTGGTVTLRSSAAAPVGVDVVGYYTLQGGVGRRLVAVTPARVGARLVTSASPMTVTVTGRNGVPRGAAAVVAQVTVVAGATKSTVRLSPDGTLARAVPVVTVPAGHTMTVPVVAPLAADGRVTVLASRAGARVSRGRHGVPRASTTASLPAGGRRFCRRSGRTTPAQRRRPSRPEPR